jgi:hypothetical protein
MGPTAEAYNETKARRLKLEAELAETDKLNINRRIQLKAQIDAIKQSEAKLQEQLLATNSDFLDQSKKLAEVEMALADTEKQIVKLGSG